jgi:antitoxin component YwqK of YwqJK toxin-antitoxin module
MKTIHKQWMKIVTFFLIVCALCLCILRNTGIPHAWVPWELKEPESLVGQLLLTPLRKLVQVCGDRRTMLYINGRVMAIEIYRGQEHRTGSGSFLFDSPLLYGYYYSPDGSLLSQIEMGNGFQLYSHENGTPSDVCLYRNGWPRGLSCVIYSNGMLNACQSTDIDGGLHGPTSEFHANGLKSYEGVFIHGEPTGVHQRWFSSGILAERTTFTTNRWQWVAEKFNPEGELIETVNYPLNGKSQP